jgi:putative ABC transport system permease protein
MLPLETRKGTVNVRVAGTTTEYMVGGMIVHMDRATGEKLFQVEGADIYMVSAAPAAAADVEKRLRKIADDHNLLLHSFADLRQRLNQMLNGLIGSLWGLLGLGLIVAAFGIANTLTMNVLEQTRDLALLRVVAMTRRQVRKTILAQALIIGLIGVVSGIIGGACGAYTTNVCSLAVLGRTVAFSVSPGLLGAIFALSIGLILIAAWFPARRATRLNLLIALHYE